MIRLGNRIAGLRRDRRGAALTEFGLVAPVLCLGMLGAYDIGHSLYMRALVQGQLQKSARDTSLETGIEESTAIDEAVRKQVMAMSSTAQVDITKRFYRTFATAQTAKGEPFTDTNKNKRCDAGEPYEDQNNNTRRDADGGDDYDDSGAKDAVVYTVKVTYPRMFPMAKLIGASPNVEFQAQTVLANQPYGDQSAYGKMTVRNCS